MAQEETHTALETDQVLADTDTNGATETTAAEQEETTLSESVEVQLARAQTELETTRDQLKRQMAEFQNYRRRNEQEKRHLRSFAQADVVQQLLDVLDDLQRSLKAASEIDEKTKEELEAAYLSLKNGVGMVHQKFVGELARLDVTPIEAVGHPFDEERHEALMQQPAPEGIPAGTVLAEIQKGYLMGERVLRHSKVVVAA